jgi:PAS domain S-box-containing protein
MPKTLPRAPMALESDAWFRVLADHTSVGLFAYRERFLWANRAAEILTGWNLAELREMHVWDVVIPSQREFVQQRIASRLRGEGEIAELEIGVLTRRGEVRWIAMSADILDGEDGPFALGTAYDITDRRQATTSLRDREERLALAQRAAHSMVWEWDLATDAIVVPDWISEFFGYPRTTAPLRGDTFVELVHPEDRPLLRDALVRTLKGE